MDDFDSLWPSMSRRWVWTCPYSILPSTSLWTAAAGSKDGSATALVSSTGAGVSTATVAGCSVSLDGSPQVKKVKQGRKIRPWQLTKSHVLDQVWFKSKPIQHVNVLRPLSQWLRSSAGCNVDEAELSAAPSPQTSGRTKSVAPEAQVHTLHKNLVAALSFWSVVECCGAALSLSCTNTIQKHAQHQKASASHIAVHVIRLLQLACDFW